MKIGYARVSSTEQNLDRQLETFKKLNIEKVYSEKISGKNTERPELKKLLDFARDGDEVIVTEFSRMSRSLQDLLDILNYMESKNVKVISLKENFDTSTPTGKLMLTLIGAINEFERACIRERQREGIKLAVDKGVYKGRKPKELKNFDEIYELWVNKRISATNAAQTLGIARQTFYSRVKQKESQG